jgi:hypothetical protein
LAPVPLISTLLISTLRGTMTMSMAANAGASGSAARCGPLRVHRVTAVDVEPAAPLIST